MVRLYVLGLILVGATACNRRPAPRPPENLTFAPALPTELSYLGAPLVFPISVLEGKINAALPATLVNSTEEDGRVRLRIERTGPVRLRSTQRDIQYAVPLRVRVWRRPFAGKRPVTLALRVRFRSRVSLDADWRLRTRTELVGYDWIDKPELHIAFVHISLTGLAERLIRKQEAVIEREIDQAIHQEVELKKPIARIWQDLQKPILINRNLRVIWLKFDAVRVESGPVGYDSLHLSIPMRVGSYLRILDGPRQQYRLNRRLPPLVVRDSLPPGSDLNVYGLLSFASLNEVLKKELAGKPIRASGRQLIIQQAEVRGNGPYVELQVDVTGALNTSIFFRGVPEYDVRRQQLVINQLDYDVNTEEMLVRAADWLLHDTFLEEVREVLNVPLRRQVDRMPSLIQDALAKGKIGRTLHLEVNQFALHPRRIVVRPEGIQTLVEVQARFAVEMKKL